MLWLPAAYENGFNLPIGWNLNKLYNQHKLPSARDVSLALIKEKTAIVRQDSSSTHFLMQWGQFIDHDITLTPMSPTIQRYNTDKTHPVRCVDSCENKVPCFPVQASDNENDRFRQKHKKCMEFIRSSAQGRRENFFPSRANHMFLKI